MNACPDTNLALIRNLAQYESLTVNLAYCESCLHHGLPGRLQRDLRSAFKTIMPLTANDTTAVSAATSMNASLRRRTSANRAARAQTTPSALSHNGLLAEEARTEERSGRRRRCKSSAATPMAATTTKATGLRNAPRLVSSPTSPRAASSSPAATTVAPRG